MKLLNSNSKHRGLSKETCKQVPTKVLQGSTGSAQESSACSLSSSALPRARPPRCPFERLYPQQTNAALLLEVDPGFLIQCGMLMKRLEHLGGSTLLRQVSGLLQLHT